MINATGPFSDSIRQMSDPGATKMIMASAGVHVTLPDYYSPEHLGMIVPKTQDGRVVFMLPWLDATIAGTTGNSSLLHILCAAQRDSVAMFARLVQSESLSTISARRRFLSL